MRGSLPIQPWTLVLLCGWTVWSALQERAATRRGGRDALTTTAPRPVVPEPRPLFALTPRRQSRSLPN